MRLRPSTAWAVSLREPGFSVFYALYRTGRIPQTVVERRAQVIGWYTGSVNSQQVAQRLRAQLPPGTQLRIVDAANGQPVLEPARPLEGEPVQTARIAGRTWRVAVVPEAKASPAGAVAVGLGGALLALLAGVTLMQSRRREDAEQVARSLAERDRARQAVLLRAAESMEQTTPLRRPPSRRDHPRQLDKPTAISAEHNHQHDEDEQTCSDSDVHEQSFRRL